MLCFHFFLLTPSWHFQASLSSSQTKQHFWTVLSLSSFPLASAASETACQVPGNELCPEVHPGSILRRQEAPHTLGIHSPQQEIWIFGSGPWKQGVGVGVQANLKIKKRKRSMKRLGEEKKSNAETQTTSKYSVFPWEFIFLGFHVTFQTNFSQGASESWQTCHDS